MKSISWGEVLVAVALATTCLGMSVIARQVVTWARTDATPRQSAFDVRWRIPQREASLAMARDEMNRAFARLTDMRLDVLHREAETRAGTKDAPNPDAARAEVIALAAFASMAHRNVRELESELAANRSAAEQAFKDANTRFQWKTRLSVAAWAGASMAVFLVLSFAILSARVIRTRLHVRRRVVFGFTLAVMAAAVLFEIAGAPAIAILAGVLTLIAVLSIARALPKEETQP